MRHLTLLLCLIGLSACQAPGLTSPARFASQAALPPDLRPTPHPGTPCKPKGFQPRAFLPPDAISPKPCPCQQGVQSRAALPPDMWPHPSQPPSNCKP